MPENVRWALIKAANETLWETINHFGYEKVKKIAEEIQEKSMVLSNESIDDNPPSPPTAKIKKTYQWLIIMTHNYESSM